MLAAEYQEQGRMQRDLPWPDWCGCYVIIHVKPKSFGRVRAHDYCFSRVRAHIMVYLYGCYVIFRGLIGVDAM